MLNTIGESSKINTYSVSNEKVVAVNSATTENKAGIDDTAAILSLSEDTFAKVYTFLKNSMGLNKAQIAGVMGNMHAESGINADNANDNYYDQEHDPQYASVYSTTDDIAFGLIQWYSEERKRGLLDMAKEMSGNTNSQTITSEIANALNDVNVQLAYFRKEMTQVSPYKESWQEIKNTYSYSGVSDVFLVEIESPTNYSQYMQERRNISATIYNALMSI